MNNYLDLAASINLTGWLGIWGAFLSTILAAVTFWDKFWKDRVRLATSYSFTGQEGVDDEIAIVNLSAIPIQVSHWSLVWRPNLYRRFSTPVIDVTPDHECKIRLFKIPAKDSYILIFSEQYKFDWGYRSARHRQLYLKLHIFGRRKPKILKVSAGQ